MSAAEATSERAAVDAAISDKPTFILVQVLRVVAAWMVVANHCIIVLYQRLHTGYPYSAPGAAGVDIFFVISGFVITLSSRKLALGARPMRVFLIRRLERVAPLYWLATTAKLLVVLLLPALAINELGSWWHVVSSYFFFSGLRPGAQPLLTVGWSLNYELFFYVVFAVAIGLRLRPLVFATCVLLAISLFDVIGAFPGATHGIFFMTAYGPVVLEFLYGIVLATLVTLQRLPSVEQSIMLILTAFTIFYLRSDGDGSLWRPFLWGAPAMAIVAAALGMEERLRRYVPPLLLLAGDASYAIYLVHGFVLPLLGILLARLRVEGTLAIWSMMLLGIGGSTFVGIVVHRYVELPMSRFFRSRRNALHAI